MKKIFGEAGSSIFLNGKYITFNKKGYIEIEDEINQEQEQKQEATQDKTQQEENTTTKKPLKSNRK